MVNLIEDVWDLVYPRSCFLCKARLIGSEQVLCLACENELPYSFLNDVDFSSSNPFIGRVNIESAWSLLQFKTNSKTQDLIHALKYRDREDIGLYLGDKLGKYLSQRVSEKISAIIPVPIHPKKLKIRGYNQCTSICTGIQSFFPVKLLDNALIREGKGKSQTSKNRDIRWQAIQAQFVWNDPDVFEDQHVLLVDDILTTGSTLEACARLLIDQSKVKVHIATLGVTSKRR